MLPTVAALTYGGHGADAESRSCGGEAELVQDGVGAGRIDHCDVAVAGGAGDHPHRALTAGQTRGGRTREDKFRGGLEMPCG